MKRPFTAFKSFLDERQQHTVFLFVCVKESANMPMLPDERRPCEMNWLVTGLHRKFLFRIDLVPMQCLAIHELALAIARQGRESHSRCRCAPFVNCHKGCPATKNELIASLWTRAHLMF